MKSGITILFFFVLAFMLHAQHTQGVKIPIIEPDQIAKIDVEKAEDNFTLYSKTLDIPLENPSPFISYSVAIFTEKDIDALEKK